MKNIFCNKVWMVKSADEPHLSDHFWNSFF